MLLYFNAKQLRNIPFGVKIFHFLFYTSYTKITTIAPSLACIV